jgi:hypothetical protein
VVAESLSCAALQHSQSRGDGVGTQNYICLPSGTGFAWTLFTPQATLFNDEGDQLTTHFFSPSPNPPDNGAIRVTWESSQDTSTIWAKLIPPSYNLAFARPDGLTGKIFCLS